MLNNEARRIPPVVEDLRAHNVAADTPHKLVLLFLQPLVSHHLGVKVLHLKGRVVDRRALSRTMMPSNKKAVVI